MKNIRLTLFLYTQYAKLKSEQVKWWSDIEERWGVGAVSRNLIEPYNNLTVADRCDRGRQFSEKEEKTRSIGARRKGGCIIMLHLY